ncbi:MAG: hypothetical protein WD648_16295 [Planctomycetaceae bacterium]
MIAYYWTAVLMLAVFAGHGCAMRGNVDLLEGRLRQQEDSLSQMQSQLSLTQNELSATRREADELRTQIAARGEKTLLAEQAEVLYRAAGIEIDRLRSGGLESDGKPGDDVLTAAIVPHDHDGELLKLAGSVELELLDLTKPEAQQRIGKWAFDSDQSREHWHRGFLGSGYFFKVPLQQKPENSKLVLHATLVTPDGRRFNASETIRVNPSGLGSDSERPVVADSKTPARKVTSDGEGPNFIRPTGGEKLMAPPLETGRGSSSGRETVDGDRAGSETFGPSIRSGDGNSAAHRDPLRISYERESDPLFDLTPVDRGDRKARADAPQGTEKASSLQPKRDRNVQPATGAGNGKGALFLDDVGTSNSSRHERAGQSRTSEPRKKAVVPFDSDLRPSVAPEELDEFGLPKNWQGGRNSASAPADRAFDLSPGDTSNHKARTDSTLPEWAR